MLLNAAIAAEAGAMTLWKVRDDAGAPAWTAQLASFARVRVLAVLRPCPDLAVAVVVEAVKAISLDDAFDRAPAPSSCYRSTPRFRREIIHARPRAPSPAIIRFEHRHLGRREHDATVRKLVVNGYRIAVGEDDTLALRHEPGAGTSATI